MSFNHPNLTAYDNFEIFSDKEKIKAYRDAKLESVQENVKFVKNLFSYRKGISVLDLGSGNSKFLYALGKANFLKYGVGIEISESRYKFAEDWKYYDLYELAGKLGSEHIFNVNANILTFDYNQLNPMNPIDCVYGFDCVIQFLEPLETGGAEKVLQKMYDLLLPKGKIVLELDECHRMLRNMESRNDNLKEVRMWEEFKEPDPFRYSLWHCLYDGKNRFLTWNKTFIKRNTNEQGELVTASSSLILRVYFIHEMIHTLEEIGFKNIKHYPSFNGNEDEYIVVGEK